MYCIAITAMPSSHRYTSGTCAGQQRRSSMSDAASNLMRSCDSGHEVPIMRMNGSACFRISAPPGPLTQ